MVYREEAETQAGLKPDRQIQSPGVWPRASPRSGRPCSAPHDTPAPSPHASGAGLLSAQAWAVPSPAMSAPARLAVLRNCLGPPLLGPCGLASGTPGEREVGRLLATRCCLLPAPPGQLCGGLKHQPRRVSVSSSAARDESQVLCLVHGKTHGTRHSPLPLCSWVMAVRPPLANTGPVGAAATSKCQPRTPQGRGHQQMPTKSSTRTRLCEASGGDNRDRHPQGVPGPDA